MSRFRWGARRYLFLARGFLLRKGEPWIRDHELRPVSMYGLHIRGAFVGVIAPRDLPPSA
jgi:hypothetical protein